MFCANCGAKLPDNARFCSSCGQKIGETVSPQQAADDFLKRLTPKQQDELFKDMAEALFAPVQELIDHLTTIAKQGTVTDGDIKTAIEVYEEWKDSTAIPAEQNRLILATQPFVLAHHAELILRQRWFSKDTSGKAKQEMLLRDWNLYFKEGMRGLLKTYTNMNDDTIDLLLYGLKGLGEWLQDETLKNLLLSSRLEKVNLPREAFAAVFAGLDSKRTQAISDYVSGIMKTVK